MFLACPQVLPLAFVARADEDADVAALWGEVWDEGTTSGGAALRLYMSDLVPLVREGEGEPGFALERYFGRGI